MPTTDILTHVHPVLFHGNREVSIRYLSVRKKYLPQTTYNSMLIKYLLLTRYRLYSEEAKHQIFTNFLYKRGVHDVYYIRNLNEHKRLIYPNNNDKLSGDFIPEFSSLFRATPSTCVNYNRFTETPMLKLIFFKFKLY